jgi:hypothetical protein
MVDTYEFRFRRRYNLPPTDPRYLNATHEEVVLDYWAHAFLDNPDMRKEDVTDDYDDMLSLMEEEMMGMPIMPPAPPSEEQPADEAEPSSSATSGNVTVTQEVVTLTEEQATDDWEDVVTDRYGAPAGLS